MIKTLRMFLWMTFLTGIAYPLLITLIAQGFMHRQASGNFVTIQGKKVGAPLIAQKFEGDSYFWPRPSAVDYNPLPSGGSNLGPTSAVLKRAVEERRAKMALAHNVEETQVPSELVYASGSGLDPHLSPAAASFQIDRIVRARGFDPQAGKKAIEELIASKTEGRRFGLFGAPCVNVLLLNLALDERFKNLSAS